MAVFKIRIEPDGKNNATVQSPSAGRDPGGWLLAQTGNNRLTNAKIESMLMAGLPESTIQMKIEAAALRGLVDLDASSNALIALKQKNAAERVLNAVVWAEPFGARRKRQQEERAVPGLPSSAGVYHKGPSE